MNTPTTTSTQGVVVADQAHKSVYMLRKMKQLQHTLQSDDDSVGSDNYT